MTPLSSDRDSASVLHAFLHRETAPRALHANNRSKHGGTLGPKRTWIGAADWESAVRCTLGYALRAPSPGGPSSGIWCGSRSFRPACGQFARRARSITDSLAKALALVLGELLQELADGIVALVVMAQHAEFLEQRFRPGRLVLFLCVLPGLE
jgi:hypothetical protein